MRPFAWAASRSFFRSALTSLVATATDFIVASALAAYGTPPGYATFVGCACGGVVAFTMNRGWAFRAQGRAAPQLLRFVGVWASSAALNSVGVALTIRLAGASFGLTWIIIRGLVYSAWNYPMLRYFVFTNRRAQSDVAPKH